MVLSALLGISDLHQKGFVHRDVKPANLFIGEQGNCLIGDFGSVNRLTEHGFVQTNSRHSLIFRPPETVAENKYFPAGDVYQAGMLLFMSLSGKLSTHALDYLSKREEKELSRIDDYVDKQLFVNGCIEKRIVQGKIIDTKNLPSFVSLRLRRVVQKAVSTDTGKRYPSAAAFHAALAGEKAKSKNWHFSDGTVECRLASGVSYRLLIEDELRVQKRKAGDWRADNSFRGLSLGEVCSAIERL